MNQPPLNPDALEAAAKELFLEDENTAYVKYPEWDSPENVGKPVYIENARAAVSAYLAAALPEVTSVEELDKLPMHTYVQGADGFKHAKDWNGGWHLIVNRPSSAPHLSGSIELPARVLYRPSEQP